MQNSAIDMAYEIKKNSNFISQKKLCIKIVTRQFSNAKYRRGKLVR